MIKKYYWIILLLGLVGAVYAQGNVDESATPSSSTVTDIFAPKKPPIFPPNCHSEGFAFDGKLLKLNASGIASRIFLLKNMSNHLLVLDHYNPKRASQGAGAGFASTLHSQQWSAVTAENPDFAISCLIRRPESIEYVACQSVLLVCGIAMSSQSALSGSYWIAEDQELNVLLQTMQEKNIVIPVNPGK